MAPGSIAAASTAALMGFIAVMLLFHLNWALLWPLFLIIPGLAALLGSSGRPPVDQT